MLSENQIDVFFNYVIKNSLKTPIEVDNYLKNIKTINDKEDNSVASETDSLYIIYNNTRINVLTYIHRNDKIDVIYGVTINSTTGEFRRYYTSYTDLLFMEKKHEGFINILYDNTVDMGLFDNIMNLQQDGDKGVINKYRRGSVVVFCEYLGVLKGRAGCFVNSLFGDYLNNYNDVLCDLASNIINDPKYEKDMIINFLYDYENGITDIVTNDINTRFLINSIHKMVIKISPDNNISGPMLKEILISYDISKLKLNNVVKNVSIYYDHHNIKTYIFENTSISKRVRDAKLIEGIDLYKILYNLHYHDIKDHVVNNTAKKSTVKLLTELHNIKDQNITNLRNTLMLFEYTGETLSDYLYILNNLNRTAEIEKNKREQIMWEVFDKSILITKNKIGFVEYAKYMCVYGFNDMLFNFIYTLVALNKRLNLIHTDLHLNNVTVNTSEFTPGAYIYSPNEYENIIKINDVDMDNDNSRLELMRRCTNIYKNIYSLSDTEKLNNTFVITDNAHSLTITDYGKAIIRNDHNIFDMLSMINHIFPSIKNNKKRYTKLIKRINDKVKYAEIFKIMSGIDVYTTLNNMHQLFSDKLNIITPNANSVELIKRIKNKSYKMMYKNLISVISHNNNKKYRYTNEVLLYKFFNKYLLKNFNRFNFLDTDSNKSKQELFVDAYNTGKYIIRSHYDMNAPLKYNDINDLNIIV